MRSALAAALLLCAAFVGVRAQQPAPPVATSPAAQPPAAPSRPAAGPLIDFETVKPIEPPAHPLSETDSAGVTRFSFLVYGDTRSGAVGDGTVVHPIHSAVMDTMLATITARQQTGFPVRFVLQTGDAVLRGATGRMWNVSYTPIIERLTKGADIPYFLTAGNHDVAVAPPGDPVRQLGLHNMLTAMSKLIPEEGSPRRLNGYATFAVGYGNVFIIAIDTTIAADPLQLAWVTNLLEHLDRQRFPHVVAFQHYPPFSSGPHGVAVEPQTIAVRTSYMPLFRRHHVRLILAGHEHLLEQWVERYTDAGRDYRIDTIVTAGGGAPTYTYRGEPDLTAYVADGASQNVRVDHLVTPGRTVAENPNHFVVVQVDGDRLSVEAIAVGNAPFAPYNGRSQIELTDSTTRRPE
jgi:3',5'-cyclic AMP phosphodiesterase CpdA